MQKIPVGETISGAYGFAFADFLTVLGTVWLPTVLFVAITAGIVYLVTPDLPGHLMRGEFDISLVGEVFRIAGLIWLVSIVFRSMVTVGLQERALGRVQGPTFFYFSLGAPVWRMIGAVFLAVLLLILIAIITAGATAIVFVAARSFIPKVGTAIGVIAIIAAVCWYIYALVRLLFFLPSVVVAEERIGLGHAWELSQGNFWRIIGVSFVVFVPVAIGFAIVQNAVIGAAMPMDFMSHFHPVMSSDKTMTPDEAMGLYRDIFKSLFQQFRGVLPFIVVFWIIRELVFLGLANGAVGKAYLALTDKGTTA